MGAYKYIDELYKKKQSDVLRFLLRVRYVASRNTALLGELNGDTLGAGNTAN